MRKLAAILVLSLTPMLLLAQGPARMGPRGGPGAGWGLGPDAAAAPQMTALRDFLGLTDTQVAEITKILQDQRTANKPIVDQLAAETKALRELLKAGNADPAAVEKAKLNIQSLRQQLADARNVIHNNVLGRLTPEQKTKLQALEDAAKLEPAIRQAAMLGLIEPPARPGPGAGMGMFGPMRDRR